MARISDESLNCKYLSTSALISDTGSDDSFSWILTVSAGLMAVLEKSTSAILAYYWSIAIARIWGRLFASSANCTGRLPPVEGANPFSSMIPSSTNWFTVLVIMGHFFHYHY